MNDQDHSLSLSDPDRSLVLSHLLVNFLKNLVSCQTSFTDHDALKSCNEMRLSYWLLYFSTYTREMCNITVFCTFNQVQAAIFVSSCLSFPFVFCVYFVLCPFIY
jgi:hypothetical protein